MNDKLFVKPIDIISYLHELNQIEFAENYLSLLNELHYKNGCLDTLTDRLKKLQAN